VLPTFGEQSRDALLAAGVPVEWRQYSIGHHLNEPEIHDISVWLCHSAGTVAERNPEHRDPRTSVRINHACRGSVLLPSKGLTTPERAIFQRRAVCKICADRRSSCL